MHACHRHFEMRALQFYLSISACYNVERGAAMVVSPLRLFAAVQLLVRCSELSLHAAHNHKHSSMQLPNREDRATLHCVDSSGKFYAEADSKDGRETRVVVSRTGTNASITFTFHAAGSPVNMSVSMSGAVAILTRDENGKVSMRTNTSGHTG